MSLAPRLDLRQSQQLVMTPQLQQAIKLLTLSNVEVEAFIAEELERNPLLDTGGSDDGPAEAPPAAEPERLEPATLDELVGAPTGDSALDVDINSEDFHQDSAADAALGGLDGGLGLGATGNGGAEDGPDFNSFAGAGLT